MVNVRKEFTDRQRIETLDNNYRGMAKIPAARRWLRRKLAAAKQRGDMTAARVVRMRMRRMGMK